MNPKYKEKLEQQFVDIVDKTCNSIDGLRVSAWRDPGADNEYSSTPTILINVYWEDNPDNTEMPTREKRLEALINTINKINGITCEDNAQDTDTTKNKTILVGIITQEI